MALIKYNKNNLLWWKFKLAILPGINEIPESVLDALLNHQLYKKRFDDGILEIISREEKIPVKKEESKKTSIEEMLKLIPDIYDRSLLEKIIKNDGRPKVIGFAEKQLQKISLKDELKAKNAVEQSANS